ncbi:MAG TPA: ribonuclease E inhibitor RraB [Anaerolineales bacterium]|nr:ribonuclease E inhibitor RraB [Anaerolineales bacterium]
MPTKEELKQQMDSDLKVIAALRASGSNLAKPHRIEHHFNADTRQDADAIVKWGLDNGFEASEIMSGRQHGKVYYYFDLIKDTVPEIRRILPDTSRLFDLAHEHDAVYDGWGCYIVK